MQADKMYLQAPVVKPRDKGQNPGSAGLWGLLGAWYTIVHEALLWSLLAPSSTLGLVDYMCCVHVKASKPRLRSVDLTAQSSPSLSAPLHWP